MATIVVLGGIDWNARCNAVSDRRSTFAVAVSVFLVVSGFRFLKLLALATQVPYIETLTLREQMLQKRTFINKENWWASKQQARRAEKLALAGGETSSS